MRLLASMAGMVLMLASGVCPAGETYRWVDERGVTNYGEKPPANRRATPVDTQTGGVIDTAQPGAAPEAERRRAADEQSRPQQQPAMAAVPSVAAVRGMEFDVYIRLQRGMTEGELLLRAGRPDHESLDGFGYGIAKTYYYLPTVSNPFTTVVSLRGGRIHELDRIKKF